MMTYRLQTISLIFLDIRSVCRVNWLTDWNWRVQLCIRPASTERHFFFQI